MKRLSSSEDERVLLIFLLSSHASLYSPTPRYLLPVSCANPPTLVILFSLSRLIVILTLNIKYLKSLSRNNSNKSMVYSVYAIQDTFRMVGWEGTRHKVRPSGNK